MLRTTHERRVPSPVSKINAYYMSRTNASGFPSVFLSALWSLICYTPEMRPKTMESRIAPGLYFCGEVLDIDGFTGGFNLQAAWATGFLAGCSARERRE